MQALISQLRNLITQNRFAAFFKHWEDNVPASSGLQPMADQLKATWSQLQDDEITGVLDSRDASARRAQLVKGLLGLVGKLPETEAAVGAVPPQAPADPLQDLIRRKLNALRRERIIATDAGVKFKLDLEIEELEGQLK